MVSLDAGQANGPGTISLSMRRADSDPRARSCVIALAPKKVHLEKGVSTYWKGGSVGRRPRAGLVSLWVGQADRMGGLYFVDLWRGNYCISYTDGQL